MPIVDRLTVSAGSNLDISFDTLLTNTTSKASEGARAHQTVLLVSSPKLGVDISYPIAARVSGKNTKLSIPLHKKLPEVLLDKYVAGVLTAEILVAGFDTEAVVEEDSFETVTEKKKVKKAKKSEDEEDEYEEVEEKVKVPSKNIRRVSVPVTPLRFVLTNKLILHPSPAAASSSKSASAPSLPPRNEVLPEIRHIFRAPPHTVSRTLAFGAILATLVCVIFLVNSWSLFAFANFGQLPQALEKAPLAHATFIASLVAAEFLFFKYYSGTSIFQTLASLAVVAPIAVFSGSRALRELKARRLNGLI